MRKIYWKAISCALLMASANYWFGELCNASYLDSTVRSQGISESAIANSLFLPNTLLVLPILGGILIDYIGVIPVLQSLNIIYAIGVVFLIIATLSGPIWLFILSSYFFGFCLHLTYVATYIYLCNTFLTKTKDIKYLRQVLGGYVLLAYMLICVSFLISSNYKILKLSFGTLLLLLAIILSFFLKVKASYYRSGGTQVFNNPLELTNVSNNQGQSLLTRNNTFEQTFMECNEKYDQDEANIPGFLSFVKDQGLKNNLKIISLGIIIGVSSVLNAARNISYSMAQMERIPDYVFGLHYAGFAIIGFGLSFLKWTKALLEKAIITGISLYVLSIIIAGIKMHFVLRIILYVFQSISIGINFYTIQLYFPYVIRFKMENIGKAVGSFWWVVSLEMFLGTILSGNNVSLTSLTYDLVFILPAIFAVVVFILIIRNENKRIVVHFGLDAALHE